MLETLVEMGTLAVTEATWAEENPQVIQVLNHLLPPTTRTVLMILYFVDDEHRRRRRRRALPGIPASGCRTRVPPRSSMVRAKKSDSTRGGNRYNNGSSITTSAVSLTMRRLATLGTGSLVMPVSGIPTVWSLLPELTAPTTGTLSVRRFVTGSSLDGRTRRLWPGCMPSSMKETSCISLIP